MHLRRTLPLLSVAATAHAMSGIPGLGHVDNLFVFGDSYTDQGRLAWFTAHGGEAPPAGTFIPVSPGASGGYSWPYFVSGSLNATTFNYAVSGATCSNDIIKRDFAAIKAPFPSVAEYEVPAFLADVAFENPTTHTNTLFSPGDGRKAENSVYALWIGTNDLGTDAFLTDSQRRTGATVARDFSDCVWGVFDELYNAGGRHFVLFNMAPLDRSPLYAAPDKKGASVSMYWLSKNQYNTTLYEHRMREQTATVNTVFEYGAPFHLLVGNRNRWPGASFTLFDVHRLLSDVMDAPDRYLDAPADAHGWYYHCVIDFDLAKNGSDPRRCDKSENPMSSFLWYDELHPSEKADQIIAAEFVKLLDGKSKYATYYQSKDSS